MLKDQLDAIEKANVAQVRSEKQAAAESARIQRQKDREIQRSAAAADRINKAQQQEHSKMLRGRLNEIEKANKAEVRVEQQKQAAVESLQRQRSNSLIAAHQREQQAIAKAQADQARIGREHAARRVQEEEQSWTIIRNVALAALVAIAVGIAGLGTAIQRAATFQRLEQGLAAMMGSASAAREEIVKLKEVAKVPGLGFREAIQGSVALQALGFNAERARKTLQQFANAVAFTGGKDELARVMIQLTQMTAAGKIIMQDLRPILQTAPVAGRALRDVFGTISPKELNAQTKSVEEFIDKWVEGLEKLPRAPDAAANAFENLSDSWDRFLISVGTPFLPLISSSLNVLAPMLEKVGTALGAMLGIFLGAPTTLGLATAAVTAFTLAVIFSSTTAIPTAINAAKTFIMTIRLVGNVMAGTAALIQGANATMAVFTLGWGAVALAIAAMLYLILKTDDAIEASTKVTLDGIQANKEAADQNTALAATMREVSANADLASMSTEISADNHEKMNAVLAKLSPTTQIYIQALTTEKEKIAAVNAGLEKMRQGTRDQQENDLRLAGATAAEQIRQIESLESRIVGLNALIRSPEAREQLAKETETSALSVDFLSTRVGELQDQLKGLRGGLSESVVKMKASSDALGMNREQLDKFFGSAGRSTIEIKKLGGMYDNLTPKVDAATNAIRDQAKELAKVSDELEGILKVGQLEIEQHVLDIVKKGVKGAEARKLAQQALKDDPSFAGLIRQRQAAGEAEKAAREVFEPPAKHARTAMESLEKQTNKVQFAVDALYASSGRSMRLKFKQEDLQQTQRSLENILKLEHDLGLELSVPPRAGGLAAIRTRTKYLEDLKGVTDAVTSASYAQSDAEFKLAQLMLTKDLPVVDSATRAQTKYISALVDRRNAELELTSDLQNAVMLRTRALQEEQSVMKDTYTQYVNLQLDAVRAGEDARLANIKASLKLAIDTGAEPALQHQLEIQLKTQAEQLKPPLVQVSEGVDTIILQLKDILGAISGKSGGSTEAGAQSYSLIGGSLGGRQKADLTRALSKVTSSPAIQRAVMAAAAATGLPPELINSVIATESGGNTRALSPKGAAGLMQMMPSHGLGNRAFNPQTNVMAGSKFLASLLQRYNGDVGLALAAYNAGPGDVKGSIPRFTETQNYVRKNEFLLNSQTAQDRAHSNARSKAKPFSGIPFMDQLFHRPSDEQDDVERSTTHQPSVSVAVEQAATRATVANTAAKQAVDGLWTAEQRLTSAQQENAETRKIVAELGEKSLEQLGIEAALKDREAARLKDDVQAAIQAGVVDHDLAEGRARDTKYVQRVIQDANRSRASSSKNTVDQIIADENLLFQIESGNEEALKQLRENSQASRVRGHLGLKQEISDLEDQIAHAGENSADRERAAYLRAQRDIIEGDLRARESQIESQVKIADQAVFHSDRVRATILDHMASRPGITEIFSQGFIDAIDTTGDAIDKVIGKVTEKMGAFGKVIQSVLSNLARLVLDKVFRTLLDAVLGPGSTGGGGGGQGQPNVGIMNFLPGMGGGGSSGGGAPGGGPLGILTQILGGGGGIGAPPSASASGTGAAGSSAWQQALAAMNGGATGSSAGMGGMLSSLGTGIAPMLPFLGAGLGANLGGSSRFGSILGGVGGGMIGLVASQAIPALLAGTFAGLTALGAATLGIGAALAIGAVILAKNAARRRDEKTRDAAARETGTAIWALIDQARLGDMTVSEANAQWNAIDKNYHEKISQIKDGKTRSHAEIQWTRDFAPLKNVLDQAVAGSVERANARARMSPVFAGGGWSHMDQLIRVRPGEGIRYPGHNFVNVVPGKDMGYDSQHMYAPKGTQVIPKTDMRSSKGYNMGSDGIGGVSNGPRTLRIDSIELNIDKDGIATAVIKSPDFNDAVVKSVRVGRAKNKL